MRYGTKIYFQRVTPGEYDASTGDYSPDTVVEDAAYASVMDTREAAMRLIYGEIRQGSVSVHLQNHYTKPFDRIRIGKKVYCVDYRRDLKVKQGFVLSEVQ